MQNDKNPKAQLQELIQRQRHPELPTYVKRSVEGPPHALVFTSSVEHASFDREYLGRGSSVKESEANAAMEALRVLRVAEVVEQRALGDWENAARFGVAVLEVLNSAGSVGLPPSVVREALEPDLRPPRGDLERRLRLVPGVGFTRSPDGNSTFYLEAYRNGAPAARSAASLSNGVATADSSSGAAARLENAALGDSDATNVSTSAPSSPPSDRCRVGASALNSPVSASASAFYTPNTAEPRFSPEDYSEEFMNLAIDRLVHIAHTAETTKWKRVDGFSVLSDTRSAASFARSADNARSQVQDFEYTMAARLGKGASGDVYLGRWAPQDRGRSRPAFTGEAPFRDLVAVKCVAAVRDATPEFFEAEILRHRALYKLQVESAAAQEQLFVGLIDVFAWYAPNGTLQITSVHELCAATLADRVEDSAFPPQSERERYYCAWQVAKAVQFMHGKKAPMLHRDIRPSNIFFSLKARVLVGDMDLARAAALPVERPVTRRDPSSTGQLRDHMTMVPLLASLSGDDMAVRGRLTLMPREVRSEKPVAEGQTDVFLVGQLWFYVFSCGRWPFIGPAAAGLGDELRQHNAAVDRNAAPSWEWLDPDTPPAMVALMDWMLEHDAAKRPSIDVCVAHPAFWSLSQVIDKTSFVWGHLCKNKVLSTAGAALRSDDASLHPFIRLLLDVGSSERPAAPCLGRRAADAAAGIMCAPRPRTCLEAAREWEPTTAQAGFALPDSNVMQLRSSKETDIRHSVRADAPACAALAWIRNLLHHSRDQPDEHAKLLDVLTTHPLTRSRWHEPCEYVIRAPAVAWLWPALWRRVLENRKPLRDDLAQRGVRLDVLVPVHLQK